MNAYVILKSVNQATIHTTEMLTAQFWMLYDQQVI